MKNENEKIIIKKARDFYLSNLKIINNEKENENENKIFEIVEKPEMNEINIILGLKLPGIKPIISSIIQKFKNKIDRITKNNENSLRYNLSEEALEDTYKKNIRDFEYLIEIELENNKFISEISKDKYTKKEFFDIFLEDFYTLFIDKTLNKTKTIIDDTDIIKGKTINQNDIIDFRALNKFLKLLVKKRNELDKIFKEENEITIIASTLIWIEAYEIEISNILEMFSKLNKNINNLYEKIEEIINNHEIEYEISKRFNENIFLDNKTLFYGMESILRVVSRENIYINLFKNQDNFLKFINTNKEILYICLKMNYFNFYSKEIYSLEEIISFIDCLIVNKKLTLENIEKIFLFFPKTIYFMNPDKEKELIDNFQFIYESLDRLNENNKFFNKTISIILKNEFIKTTDDNFKKLIIKIILNRDEFI